LRLDLIQQLNLATVEETQPNVVEEVEQLEALGLRQFGREQHRIELLDLNHIAQCRSRS
jgi:hypothetical protein